MAQLRKDVSLEQEALQLHAVRGNAPFQLLHCCRGTTRAFQTGNTAGGDLAAVHQRVRSRAERGTPEELLGSQQGLVAVERAKSTLGELTEPLKREAP